MEAERAWPIRCDVVVFVESFKREMAGGGEWRYRDVAAVFFEIAWTMRRVKYVLAEDGPILFPRIALSENFVRPLAAIAGTQ